MTHVARARLAIVWFLSLQLCLPATSVWASPTGPTDGTTPHGMRGEVAAGGVGLSSLGVGGSNGAATYGVPIQAAVGTGGLTPQLKLQYNSQARSDSWVGHGWSLGLPSIARSLVGGIPDYDDQADIFTFAGMELVPDDSNPALPRLYHTWRQSFLRIIHEADDTWTVTRKDGSRIRLGLTADARLGRSASETFAWLYSEEEDVFGNVIVAAYDTSDPGFRYLQELRYTLRRQPNESLQSLGDDPSRDRVISFVLEASERPDLLITYSAGFRSELRRRLDYIDVRAAGDLIRRYDLVYDESPDSFRSLLAALHEYGADAAAPTPTDPFVTTFTYGSNVRDGTTGWQEVSWSWPANVSLMGNVNVDGGTRLGDVDGDGLLDLIKMRQTLTNTGMIADPTNGVYRNLGSGFSITKNFDVPQPAGNFRPAFAVNDVQMGTNTTYSLGTDVIDLTGDGRVDLVGYWNAVNYQWWGGWPLSGYLPWYASNGAGFSLDSSYYEDPNLSTAVMGLWAPALADYIGVPGSTTFADLNGDALPDIITRGAEAIFTDPDTGIYACDTATAYSYVAYNQGSFSFTKAPTTTHNGNVDSTAPPGLPVCTPSSALRTVPLYSDYPGPLGSKIVRSSEYEPCNPVTDSTCHLRLYHNARAITQGNWVYGCIPNPFDLRYDPAWNCNPFYIDSHHQFGNYEVDINSDGLADVISAFSAAGTPIRAALLNNGNKAFDSSSSWAPNEDLMSYGITDYFSEDHGWRFADVNGDGRVDLVRAVFLGLGRETLLNDGDVDQAGDTGPWRSTPAWNLPEDAFFTHSSGADMGGRLAEMNGDGMVDFVYSIGTTNRVWLNKGRVPDLLEEITNSLGGTTSIEYSPSTLYDNTGSDSVPDLPQIIQAVSEVTVEDGLGGSMVSEYSYEGGLFDATRREFRGFESVALTNAEGTTTRTKYHQNDALSGLVEQVTVRDSGGNLWLTEDTDYKPVGSPPYLRLVASVTMKTWDGQLTAQEARHEFDYDAYGNITRTTTRADANLPGTPDRVALIEYTTPNLTKYIVGAPKRRQEVDPTTQTTVLSEVEYYYDDQASIDAAPIFGLPTKSVYAKAPNVPVEINETFAYDKYGNPTDSWESGRTVDHIDYDPVFHTFVTAINNSYGHTTQVSYDAVSCTFVYPSGGGLIASTTDPNLQTTSICYDAFGRPTWASPPDSAKNAVMIRSYDDTPGTISATVSMQTSASTYRTATSYKDGLGRVYRSVNDGPGGMQIERNVFFDALGRVDSEELPHEMGASALLVDYQYDTVSRLDRVDLPGGRFLKYTHDRGAVTVEDAKLDKRAYVYDAYGDLRQSTEYPNGPAGAAVTTQYTYDHAGRLRVIMPPNPGAGEPDVPDTEISYDVLGRRDTMVDPDHGTATFVYDEFNDLREIRQGTSITQRQFDALHRPTQIDVYDSAQGTLAESFSSQTLFTWDLPGYSGSLSIGRAGRIATTTRKLSFGSVTEAMSAVHSYGYDELGRPDRESHQYTKPSLALFEFETNFNMLGDVQRRVFPKVNGGGQDTPIAEIGYTYDNWGYLESVKDLQTRVTLVDSIDRDAELRLKSFRTGDSVVETNTYDPMSNSLKSRGLARAGAPLSQHEYVLDASGGIDQVLDLVTPGRDVDYEFDGVGRLTGATGPYGAGFSQQALSFGYDTFGNLTQKDGISRTYGREAGGLPSNAGTIPHAVTDIGGTPLAYDDRGNLTQHGTRQLSWYSDNMLRRVDDSGNASEYWYDYDGRRYWTENGGGTLLEATADFDYADGKASVHIFALGRRVATRSFDLDLTLLAQHGEDESDRFFYAGLLWFILIAPPLFFLLAGLLDPRRWRLAIPTPRVATAALTAAFFWIGTVAPAHAVVGDLDEDGILDVDDLDRDNDGLPDAYEAIYGYNANLADSDADGLSDRAELIRGTDPLDPDSDNDGVPDGSDVDPSDGTVTRRWEVPSIGDATADGQLDVADGVRAARIASAAESGSPGELSQLDVVPTGAADGIVDTRDATLLLRAASDQDVDGDGLASRAEVLAGASPFLVDSDGDGVGDATELASGTDPARPDSDSDGLTDLEEVTAPPVGVDPALTDPAVTDTDEDGIPDGADGRPLDAYVFYHGDLLGSSTLVTNVRGDILAKLLYKPFGESLIEAGSTPEFGFTGQRFEGETGLYNYGARVYDPVIGRMISADSVVPDPANLQALNRYSYVFNDPVHYADPSGNTPQLQVTGPGTQQYDPAVFEARFQGAVNAGAGTNPGGGFYSGGGFSGFEHGAGNAVLLGAMQRNAAAAHARAQAAAHAAAHPRPDWSSYADTAGMAAQIGTEAFVPFFSTATAFAAGDWRTAAQEAAFELGGIALGAATLGPGYYAVKTLKAYRAVRKAQKLATRGKTEVVHRWMSKAELNATKESGLMRGGREGRHFVTDSANSTAKRARQRLALDRTPEVRVRLEVPAGKFSSPTRVDPKHSMPGGGMERSAVGDIPVRVLD